MVRSVARARSPRNLTWRDICIPEGMRLVAIAFLLAGCSSDDDDACTIVRHDSCPDCGPGEVRAAFTTHKNPYLGRIGEELVCLTCRERLSLGTHLDTRATRTRDYLSVGDDDVVEDQAVPGPDGLVFSLRHLDPAGGRFLVALDGRDELWRRDVEYALPGHGLVAGTHGPLLFGFPGSELGVTAFANDGSIRWTLASEANDVDDDGAGGAYLFIHTDPDTPDTTLTRVDASGSTLWTRTLPATRLVAMAPVGDGVAIAGRDGTSRFLARIDAAGTMQEKIALDDTVTLNIRTIAMIDGDFVVGGTYSGTPLGLPPAMTGDEADGFVARFTPAGVATSAYAIGGSRSQSVRTVVPGDGSLLVEVETLAPNYDESTDLLVAGRRFAEDHRYNAFHILELGI